MIENPYLVCQDCGKQDESVRDDNCPLMDYSYDQSRPIVICPDCYDERVMSI